MQKTGERNLTFVYGGSKPSQGLFILKIFAVDQKEALKRAIRIRNAAIKNGEMGKAKRIIIDITIYLYVLLFMYAATSKLVEYDKFQL